MTTNPSSSMRNFPNSVNTTNACRRPPPVAAPRGKVAVQRFVRDTVVPYEQDPRIDSRGPADELRRELQQAARARGLVAPPLSLTHGGRGLDHRQTATVFRASGYSLLGPLAMNAMAPDEGNMYLLEKIARPAQLE